MEVASTKLWNRDFSLLIIGQTVSLFGNMILSFALPLYILDISGSAALFGLVLSLPYISLIIVSPVGGIIADRLRKQRIMFWLDAATTVIIVLYMAVSGLFAAIVPVVIVKLMALNAIQGLYLPAVQASVPLLVPTDKLVPANAVVSIINMLSSMAGIAIAGVLYARFGLFPILAVSAICFAITAAMDLLIRIPFKKQESHDSLVKMVKSDMSLSAKFMVKEKPVIAKCAFIAFLMQVSLASMLVVGIPVLITQHLNKGMDLVGYSQSIMMVGGLAGAIIASSLGAKLTIGKMPLMLLFGSLAVMPIGLIFMFELPAMLTYIIMTAACALAMCALQIAQIQFFAFIQEETPSELTGKVMSLIVMMPFVASALGYLIYGVLFEQFKTLPWVVIFITIFISAMIAAYARGQFKTVGQSPVVRP